MLENLGNALKFHEALESINPLLYSDLLKGLLTTLSDFSVEYRHLKVEEPKTPLEKKILKKMCIEAATTIDKQRGF